MKSCETAQTAFVNHDFCKEQAPKCKSWEVLENKDLYKSLFLSQLSITSGYDVQEKLGEEIEAIQFQMNYLELEQEWYESMFDFKKESVKIIKFAAPWATATIPETFPL